MVSNVPANSRRSRDDDYNFYLPESNYLSLISYPTLKLVLRPSDPTHQSSMNSK